MGAIEKIAVDNATLAKLEQSALAHGRSVEEEAAELLRLATNAPSRIGILRRFDEIAALTPKGVEQTDRTVLVREDRNRQGADYVTMARRIRAMTPKGASQTDSTQLIREDRDR